MWSFIDLICYIGYLQLNLRFHICTVAKWNLFKVSLVKEEANNTYQWVIQLNPDPSSNGITNEQSFINKLRI